MLVPLRRAKGFQDRHGRFLGRRCLCRLLALLGRVGLPLGLLRELFKASKTLEAFPTIKTLEDELRAGIAHLSGKAHDIDARLRFAPAEPPYARLLSQAITLVYGRHASEREEQNLSAQRMGFLNASLGTTETTHFWLQRFSRELVTLWRMIARNSEQEWDVCAEMITNIDPTRDLDLSLAYFFTCSASQRAQAFICTE